ncbi:MAG TPA: universal stress protein [Nitrospirota bacterium]|nr:universal stress protein [Nitrospirota bacterium]
MKGYRKVLIALNGKKEVLEQGVKLAHDEKTWITVVKVVQPFDGDLNLTGIKNLEDVLDDGSRQAVNEINRVASREGALIKTRLEQGDVPQRIVEVAEEERCDLIIMGSKKKKGIFSRLFGDHIVEKVIDRAPCPVYVVAV